jgi:hypothetical protein
MIKKGGKRVKIKEKHNITTKNNQSFAKQRLAERSRKEESATPKITEICWILVEKIAKEYFPLSKSDKNLTQLFLTGG